MFSIRRDGQGSDGFLAHVEDVGLFVTSGVEQHHHTSVDTSICRISLHGLRRLLRLGSNIHICMYFQNTTANLLIKEDLATFAVDFKNIEIFGT